MNKRTKGILGAAGVSMIVGAGLMLAGRFMGGETGFYIDRTGIYTNQDIRERSRQNLYTMEKTQLEDFHSMEFLVEYNDIEVVPSKDGHFYMEYQLYLRGDEPRYEVEDGRLTMKCVQEVNSSTFHGVGFLAWNTDTSSQHGMVRIYAPQGIRMREIKLSNSDGSLTYDGPDADIYDFTSDYGAIHVNRGNAKQIYLYASDGNITCDSVTCEDFTTENQYGRTELKDISAKNMKIDASDGKIILQQINTDSATIVNQYGRVEADQIKADVLSVTMSDGTCSLRRADLGNAVFENTYGTVAAELEGRKQDYNYDLETTYGSITVDGDKLEESYRKDNKAQRNLTVTAKDGNVQISFTK